MKASDDLDTTLKGMLLFGGSAFLAGFFLSLSLILAIGAQNIFVLRQGLKQQHVLPLVLFCTISDAFLIYLGVLGLGTVMATVFQQLGDVILSCVALWLVGYGVMRLRDAFYETSIDLSGDVVSSLKLVLSSAAVLTFGNPHVYVDTIFLIGASSTTYAGEDKIAFACGAVGASFVFFTALGYGASYLGPLMTSPLSWRIVDSITGVLMLGFAIVMLSQTSIGSSILFRIL